MPKTFPQRTTLCHLVLLAIVSAIGCAPDPVVVEQEGDEYVNLMAIESAYRQFCESKRKPPTGMDDLKPFGTTEDSFVSSRDGQPLKIFWGTPLDETDFDNPTIIAHEVEGRNGKRLVLSTVGVMMLSEEEFSAARFPSTE